MRPLRTSCLTALAISAAFTFGTAGPAVADIQPPSSPATIAAKAPLPDTGAKAAAPADVVDDTLAAVQDAVAALLASVSGTVTGVVPQVTSLVDQILGSVLGGLSLPDLGDPPNLPTLPVTVPGLPVDLPVDPPAVAPEVSTLARGARGA
ncbi:hypothetical protein [Streptomyces sp. NBC_01353]|uniref:hypothetical protein n=1 Tax=Streptomyces sp. NBC_01353 TaxID=2903835 RepID=UPI002E35565C|nr:hypothetical protein [Streptomyces sp. NBC_01353]